jgi:hypothetical protein
MVNIRLILCVSRRKQYGVVRCGSKSLDFVVMILKIT